MPKIGCISPSILQLPWDLSDLLPANVNVIIATLNNRNGQAGEEVRSNAALPGAVNVLADENAGAIVALGIPNAARRGLAADQKLLGDLGHARSVPIVSSLMATALACLHLGVRHALLITQYDDDANDKIVTYCREAGVSVDTAVGLGCRNAVEVNAKTPADYDALARKMYARYPHCDAVVILARGNMAAIARALESETGIPVMEQAQATVWWSLSQLGLAPAAGHGKLLSSVVVPAAVAV